MATEARIGTRIKRARERKRMSQAELADTLGVSRSAVNAWENDRALPQSSIGAIEDILGIRLDEPSVALTEEEIAAMEARAQEMLEEARRWRAERERRAREAGQDTGETGTQRRA